MKTEPNDPVNYVPDGRYNGSKPGISKREYFAAMAMQGILSDSQTLLSIRGLSRSQRKKAENIVAASAVENADALIAELNKEKKS